MAREKIRAIVHFYRRFRYFRDGGPERGEISREIFGILLVKKSFRDFAEVARAHYARARGLCEIEKAKEIRGGGTDEKSDHGR